jgi:hypothetical protein
MQKKNDPLINILTSKLIFIGGVTRSGKSFLCPIISTFDKTEMFIYNSAAENIYYLNYLKMISNESAYYLFKHIFNEKIYNLNIGRDLNRRKFDYTSVDRYRNSKIYLQREKSIIEGDVKIKDIRKSQNYYPIMFHDILINPNFIFKSFQKSKVIFIERHPVDLIFEWKEKKYYGQFYSNPRNCTLAFDYKKKFSYPFWCKGHENEFVKLNNVYEKTIFLLDKLYNIQKKNYLKYKKKYKKNLLLLKFETLVQDTDIEINKIEKFLNLKKSSFTQLEIRKQNGNRENLFSIRKIRRDKIIHNISDKYKQKLIKLENLYKKK